MSKYYLGDTHTFTSRTSSRTINLLSGKGEIINFEKSVEFGPHIQYVHELDDFPSVVAGVITLEDDKVYVLMETIDLLGSRIVCGANNSLQGFSINSNAGLTSTGLAVSTALITSTSTFSSNNVNYDDIDTLFDFDGSGTEFSVVVNNSVITNVPHIGTIQGYTFINWDTTGFVNSSGLIIDGSINVLSARNCSFNNNSVSITSITIPATAVFTGRIKLSIDFSTSEASGTALDVSVSATILDESYQLINCNFVGYTTPLAGVLFSDNKTLFKGNTNIQNSVAVGSLFTNVSAPTTVVLNTWTKVLGTTTIGSFISKFTMPVDNRLTYTGPAPTLFDVHYASSVLGGNSKDFSLGVSLNGADPTAENTSFSVTDSGGKLSNIGNKSYITLSDGDFIELWIRNTTDSTALTCQNINLQLND